jgi:hypothetical protein
MTTAEIIYLLRSAAAGLKNTTYGEAADRLEAAEAVLAALTEGQPCPYWDVYSPRVTLPWQEIHWPEGRP